MTGSFARSKGQRGEREVRDMLQPIVDRVCQQMGVDPVAIKRNLSQVREGGHDLIGLDWLAIEVKRQETLNVGKWWEQAEEQARRAGPEVIPILIYKQNHQKWRVRMVAWLHCGHSGHQCVAEVTLEDFLKWFEMRLTYHLGLR